MIEKGDFRFRDDLVSKEDIQTVPIEILTGPYKNVIYRYVKVSVKEKDDGEAVVQFLYDLLEMGKFSETTLRNDQRFTNHIGLILNHLVLEAAEAGTNDAGENYSEEPVEQRGLLP
jgi:hypothetical protein